MGYEIPQIFKDKIKLDSDIIELKKRPVVSLAEFRETRIQQRLTRYSCHNFIKRQRGDRDGGPSGGSPVMMVG